MVAVAATDTPPETVTIELNLEESAWLIHSFLQANPAYGNAILTEKAPAWMHPMLQRMHALHLRLNRANDILMGKEVDS